MSLRWIVLVLITAILAVVTAQRSAAQPPPLPQPQLVIDKPTAGMLPHGSYMLRGQAGAESSFLLSATVGFKEFVQFGLSFGAQNVFEYGSPVVNDFPGIHARVRLAGESEQMPALALGFNSQGIGVYHKQLERYDRKSVGFYGVASKNFALILGELSLHGGINWSTEKKDDSDPTVFGALDWTFFQRLSFLLTVDGALNDNEDLSFGKGGVYIDVGIGWTFGEFVNMTLAFRDLTDNFRPTPGTSREFQLTWINSF